MGGIGRIARASWTGLIVLFLVGGAVLAQRQLAPSASTIRAVLLMAGVATITLVATVLLSRRRIRSQLRPLRQTVAAVISSGDHTLRINSAERINSVGSGEIGTLGQAIDLMLEVLAAQGAAREKASATREDQLRNTFAQRRLAEQQERRRAQTMINETVASVVTELQNVIEQTSAVREAADSIEGRVGATGSITRDAVDRAGSADHAVAEFSESLRKVDGIARLITNVAAQTHLLALNATIEAARAGVAGKGFSVVANEVKELANATARSTKEITLTVRALAKRATAVATVISDMTGGISRIDDATAQVRFATQQQNSSVERLNASLGDAIHRIEMMAHLTEQLERRGVPRVPTHGVTTLRHRGSSYTAQMLDLSESGARCVIDGRAQVKGGDTVDVDIAVGVKPPTSLPAMVMHRNEDEMGAELGLRFIDTPPEVSIAIRELVAISLNLPRKVSSG